MSTDIGRKVLYMKSVWQETAEAPELPAFEGDAETDVLVIGAGAAGLLTGYYLKQAGIDCLVVDGKRVCGGTSGLTTAKVTLQHGLCYGAMAHNKGFEFAKGYYKANREALGAYGLLAEKYDFDLRQESNFVYSNGSFQQLRDEYETLKMLGADTVLHNSVPLPVEAVGMVEVKNQFSMHPLKLFYALARELRVRENCFVRRLDGTVAFTDKGRIRANKIVVATHFPFINSHGMYFVKLYQHRSYVVGLENGPDVGGMYVDDASDGFSFRNWGSWLLIGGGGHKTGEKGGGPDVPAEFARRHFPEAKQRFCWAAQDCMSLDGVPYIGRYSSSKPDIFVAAGFNKWGMSSSMVAARLLTELITRGQSEYGHIFSPQRSMLCNQLAKNGLSAAKGLLTPSTPRCTHMGCALKENRSEGTWDCPCHGSRFDREGRVLENPAMKDLKHPK